MTLEQIGIFHQVTHILTLPFAVVLSVWYAPKYGYSRKMGAMYATLIVELIVLFTYACRWIPGLIGIEVYLNSYRSFLVVPIFTWLLCRDWKIPVWHGADFVTPILFSQRAMVLIGCTMAGCGMAVPCDWGTYNPRFECNVFPMDLIDLIANTLVAIFSFYYAKKLNYKGDGRIFAMCMSLLGFVRVFLQFGSLEVWWVRGFNDETVYSLASFAIAIYIFHRYKKKHMEEKL